MPSARQPAMWPRFHDRREAGGRLAQRLRGYANRADVIVLALPRGGVPVAAEVADELRVPLDVLVVGERAVPGQEELAMGALASGGTRVLDDELIRMASVDANDVERATAMAADELSRQEAGYSRHRRFPQTRAQTHIMQ